MVDLKIIIIACSFFFNSVCSIDNLGKSNLDQLWNDFKNKFNKSYEYFHEYRRREAWENNLYRITNHNKEAEQGLHSFYIKENHLTDLSPQVYLQKMAKLTRSHHRKIDTEMVGDYYEKFHHLPEEIDWRNEGFQTPVYNQKDCGSCYAFSIATVLQAQVYKETKKLIPLSEQQIIDCSIPSGNYGCSGGSLRNTLKYLDKSGGLMTSSDYPYIARQKKCHFNIHRALVNVSSWAILPPRNERALEIALAKIGPVAASINASPHTFQLYHKGIYDDPACSSNTVNHAMVVVGYTKDAWILKNWWGSNWGENGYMRLRRRKNMCGISNFAAYALV